MDYYFITFSIIFVIALLFVGYISTKNVKSYDHYFLAGRKLGIFSVCISLLATQIGGGVIVGTSQASYKYGIYGIFYTLGLSLGFIALAFFGAKQLREKNISTVAELFEKEYNSVFLKKVASSISIVSLYGIVISMIVSTKAILIALGIKNELMLYAFWVAVITYTVSRGFKAVVYINIVKITTIFIIFSTVIAYYAFVKFEYIQFSLDNLLISVENTKDIPFGGYILIPFLFIFIEQDMAQNFFAAKNTKVAYTSAFIAGFLLLIFSFVPVLFGVAARSMSDMPEGANEMMFFFAHTSNPFITTIVSIAILAAIVATGDSLLCAIGTNLALDFGARSANNLIYSRILTMTLGVAGIAIAHYFHDIIKIMLISYEIMICTLFFPIVASYFNFKNSTSFAYIAIFIGLMGFILHEKFMIPLDYPITREIFCISLSFLALPLSRMHDKFFLTNVEK